MSCRILPRDPDREQFWRHTLERSTTFAYDAAGNQTDATDPLGTVTHAVFDKLNRAVEAYAAYGTADQIKTATAFDKAGRVASTTDGRGKVTAFGYDDAGRRTSVTDPRGKATLLGYDPAGRVTSVTDPLGHATTLGYDPAGRLVSVADPLSNTTTFAYDAAGNRTATTDPRGNTTAYAFDNLGRLAAVTNALSETTTFAYDAVGNRTGVTNARSATWATAYDALDRPVTVTDPLGHATAYAYSAAGDVMSVTDPLGKAVTFGYDALGRRQTVTSRAGGVTATAYDAADRVISVTDPMGGVTGYGYDRVGRVVNVTDPLGSVTLLGYDGAGNRAWVEDAMGNKTAFGYDDAGRLTAEADALGAGTAYGYDDANRLVSVTDRLGRRRAFGYDAAGRETSESWYSAANALVQTQTFGYDAAGNQTAATDPDGNYSITYDKLNRAVVVAGPVGFTQAFAYDEAGNRVSVADSKGGVTASTFDPADRLTSRSFADGTGQARLDYAYTDRGELKAVTRFADTAGTTKVGTSSYAYDDGGRVTAITHRDGAGATLAGFTYAYDKADRLTQTTEGGVTTLYGYDKAGQVVQEGATLYTYDKAGNRAAAGYATGAGNRVTAGGGWAYGYDAAGQVMSKSKAGEYWAYGYDHRGQLVSAAKSASAGGAVTDAVGYQYDAWGNLVGRTQTGSAPASERYAVDGWDTAKPDAVGAENFDAVADLDAAGNVTARRVFGAGFDTLGVRVDGGGDGWYLADRQGSVRAVAGPGGAVTGTRAYDAFGAATAAAGAGLDRYGYTGRESDGLTGQAYYRGRWADPGAGRFTTEDPIRWAAGDPNLYRYVGNSPTNATDPSGMWIYLPRTHEGGDRSRTTNDAELIVADLQAAGIRAVAYTGDQSTWGKYDRWVLMIDPADYDKFAAWAKGFGGDWGDRLLRAAFSDRENTHVELRARHSRFEAHAGRAFDPWEAEAEGARRAARTFKGMLADELVKTYAKYLPVESPSVSARGYCGPSEDQKRRAQIAAAVDAMLKESLDKIAAMTEAERKAHVEALWRKFEATLAVLDERRYEARMEEWKAEMRRRATERFELSMRLWEVGAAAGMVAVRPQMPRLGQGQSPPALTAKLGPPPPRPLPPRSGSATGPLGPGRSSDGMATPGGPRRLTPSRLEDLHGDRLEELNDLAARVMTRLGVPREFRGIEERGNLAKSTTGRPFTFEHAQGGRNTCPGREPRLEALGHLRVVRRGINVDGAVLDDNFLPYESWRSATVEHRMEAVIAHELVELRSPGSTSAWRHAEALLRSFSNPHISAQAKAIIRDQIRGALTGDDPLIRDEVLAAIQRHLANK